MKPGRYTPDGSPCYDIAKLALALDLSEDEITARIMEQERRHSIQQGFSEDDLRPLQ